MIDMDQSIDVVIPAKIPDVGRLVDLVVRFATAFRAAGARARLGPADETAISRSSGGRC
jgi:hypothetical protein